MKRRKKWAISVLKMVLRFSCCNQKPFKSLTIFIFLCWQPSRVLFCGQLAYIFTLSCIVQNLDYKNLLMYSSIFTECSGLFTLFLTSLLQHSRVLSASSYNMEKINVFQDTLSNRFYLILLLGDTVNLWQIGCVINFI